MMWMKKKKDENHLVVGSWEWILSEKPTEQTYSEYFLTKTTDEWIQTLTISCAIEFWFAIMNESAEKNTNDQNHKNTDG